MKYIIKSTRFENLITRFEEPDSRNRWDAPLFTILYDDEVDRFIKPIVDAVVLRKPPPPNMSTLVVCLIWNYIDFLLTNA